MFGIAKSICALIGVSILLASTIAPDHAEANERHRPGFRPGHHKPWPGYRPNRPNRPSGWLPPFRPPRPSYRPPHYHRPHYTRWDLPKIAKYSIIAGVTYAIVDNLFYKQQGDQYVYVQQPPIHTTTTTVTTTPTYGGYTGTALGSTVHGLPLGATSVVVNGSSFFVVGNTWYAPLASGQYVVVTPQM